MGSKTRLVTAASVAFTTTFALVVSSIHLLKNYKQHPIMKLTTLVVFLFSTLASVQAQSHSGNTLQPVSTGTSSEPDPTIGIPRPHSRPITTDSTIISDTSTLLTIQTSTALTSSTITTTDSSTIATTDSSSNSSSTAPPTSSSSLPGSTTSSIASNSTSPAGNGAVSMVSTSALGVLMGVFALLALTT